MVMIVAAGLELSIFTMCALESFVNLYFSERLEICAICRYQVIYKLSLLLSGRYC